MKNFNELSEREVLALAISLEEEDERVYADFSEGLRQEFPASATVFDSMRKEESGHRRRLIELKTMNLRPGSYDIEVRAPGRTQFDKKVYAAAGKTLHLNPDL